VRDTADVRATGLQGDHPSELIEILDDDIDAFGNRAPNITIHDAGGPRWVGPVAAAALVALLAYGVATSGSSGAPNVARAPSTTAARPTTTPPAPSTTVVPPPLVPYYSADPPREFIVSMAETYPPDGSYFGPGKYQLWATAGATASSGSWFSIQTYPGRMYALDAYRAQAGERSIGVSHTASGQTIAQFSAIASGSVTITSLGMSDEDLVRLAASITIGRGSIRVNDPSVVPGYELITSVQPWLAVQGIPVETVAYQPNQDPSRVISVSVAQRTATNQGGSTLDRQIALRFWLDHTVPFDVDGHVAVAGTPVGQSEYAVSSWIAGDHIVTVAGFLTVPELIAVARTVHQVSFDEWQGMQFQASANHDPGNDTGGFAQTPAVAVSFGTDGESNQWIVKAGTVTFSNNRQTSWQWDDKGLGGGIGAPAGDTATINTVVDGHRTYVLADLPRALGTTAQLQITRDGFDPVLVPFNDVLPDFDRTLAAYAFTEPTTYSAQIIAQDGTVLAGWPQS
jgi:hypothetical protein